jgi:hypothetical protein
MGKQVNFYLLPADLVVVEDAIRSTGPVAFLPNLVPEPLVKQLPTIAISEAQMGKEPLRVYVTHPKCLKLIRFRPVPERGYFIIEPGSPVIELDRNYVDDQRIRHGRLYFYTGSDFDPEFMKWAEGVLRAVRKVLVRKPELGGEYFGPGALEWIKKRRATVQPGVAAVAQSA